ncbi:MAG: hypothetical protein FWC41_09105 [Firmicutes bacterium]|nr:hypothetical protein [Bacillota bacterium]
MLKATSDAPKEAIIVKIFKLNSDKIEKITRKFKKNLINEFKNETILGSILDLCKKTVKILLILFIAKIPIAKINNEIRMFFPNVFKKVKIEISIFVRSPVGKNITPFLNIQNIDL